MRSRSVLPIALLLLVGPISMRTTRQLRRSIAVARNGLCERPRVAVSSCSTVHFGSPAQSWLLCRLFDGAPTHRCRTKLPMLSAMALISTKQRVAAAIKIAFSGASWSLAPRVTHSTSSPFKKSDCYLAPQPASRAVPKQSRISCLPTEQSRPPDGHSSALARRSRRARPLLPLPALLPWSQHPPA